MRTSTSTSRCGWATWSCPTRSSPHRGRSGHGDEVARLCPPDRLGAVTVKSLAAFEWPGNPAPRLAPAAGGGMLNSVGLQGPGIEHWIEHGLPELRALGARVIASVWGRTVDDFAVARRCSNPRSTDLVGVEVNVSCPNVEDRARMFAHSPRRARRGRARGRGRAARAAALRQALAEHVRDRRRRRRALDAGAPGSRS